MYNIEIIDNGQRWLAFVKPVSYDEALVFSKNILKGKIFNIKVYS